jgi:hypothetical protein
MIAEALRTSDVSKAELLARLYDTIMDESDDGFEETSPDDFYESDDAFEETSPDDAPRFH